MEEIEIIEDIPELDLNDNTTNFYTDDSLTDMYTNDVTNELSNALDVSQDHEDNSSNIDSSTCATSIFYEVVPSDVIIDDGSNMATLPNDNSNSVSSENNIVVSLSGNDIYYDDVLSKLNTVIDNTSDSEMIDLLTEIKEDINSQYGLDTNINELSSTDILLSVIVLLLGINIVIKLGGHLL